VPEIRRIRVNRLVLSGVPRDRRRAVAAAVERALAEGAQAASGTSPDALKAGVGTTVGRAIATALAPSKMNGRVR
jgi:hypothetical protein